MEDTYENGATIAVGYEDYDEFVEEINTRYDSDRIAAEPPPLSLVSIQGALSPDEVEELEEREDVEAIQPNKFILSDQG